MKNPIQIAATALFLVVVAGVIIYATRGDGEGQSETPDRSEARAVNIIKYSDFQCPYCKYVLPLEAQLKEEFGDLITIEYRHFPLSSHQFSELAARAAEAARKQGQFREMHDKIFAGQEEWSKGGAESIFTGYAEEIGLDVEQFETDINSEEVLDIVKRQKAEGERRTVSGTPTYFFNGEKINQVPQNYGQLRALVEMFMYRQQ